MFASGSNGSVAAQSLTGPNVRVSTHDFFPADPFFSSTGAPDVLQQNEPSIAVHPQTPTLIAVGMNDVRTLAISDDAWQGLAVSTDGGASFAFEALVPGFPGDTSPEGLASPIRGNAAASDPVAVLRQLRELVLLHSLRSANSAGTAGFRSGADECNRRGQIHRHAGLA
jgi:hypothetical protein